MFQTGFRVNLKFLSEQISASRKTEGKKNVFFSSCAEGLISEFQPIDGYRQRLNLPAARKLVSLLLHFTFLVLQHVNRGA